MTDNTIDGFRVLFKGLYIHQDAVDNVSKVLSMDVDKASKVVLQLDNKNREYINVYWFDPEDKQLDMFIISMDGVQMVFDDTLRALQTLIKMSYTIESNTAES